MSKHTPGPWFPYGFDSPSPHGRPYVVAQLSSNHLRRGATVTCGQYNPNAGTYWPAEGDGGRSDEEINANMHLIAAAPDLLDACRNLSRMLEAARRDNGSWFADEPRIVKARAAIAKAEGRSA